MNGKYVTSAIPVVLPDNPVERLASLFDAHHERLYRLARRLVPSKDDALDLVQETFLRAARFPKAVPVGPQDEEAWLVRVLINICRDQWRKASARNRLDKARFRGSDLPSRSQDPEAALVAKSAIWQALDALRPRRRAIVVMYELEELAIPTIAALLGITSITVRWHLSMGRRELAAALKAFVGDTNENY
jgi:RNA polymerase sigma-70 factor, ECF subfamily